MDRITYMITCDPFGVGGVGWVRVFYRHMTPSGSGKINEILNLSSLFETFIYA